MKPKSTKVSTGYLTPQSKKPKPTSKKPRLSDLGGENETSGINTELFEALLQNPEKKKMILQLLSSNKDIIDKHSGSSLPSSVDKLKSKKVCESPTALMRRRALEKMNGSPTTSNNFLSKYSSSSSSSSTTLDKVLEGVKAYVEIRDKNNEDKSRGAKEILKSMGATVVDKLTSEVTHVVFKDGSYKTFQKAKLLKVHIVSILWVEFSRKALQRANEKRFPALGDFEDETMVVSQMHKEYEEIIRDEYRKSIIQGSPLPTTKALINRRRTLMTPSITANNNSDSSYNTAISSQALDREVATITEVNEHEELIMNDPEGLTLAEKVNETELSNIQNNSNNQTPKRVCNNKMSFDRRKTIGHTLCSDLSTNTADLSTKNTPRLYVSIEKLQFTSSSDSGTEINVEQAISALKSPINSRSTSASSNDSEILLPSTGRFVGHKRRTLAASQTLNKQNTETRRRRTLAFEKLQVNSDSSCDSSELFNTESKIAADGRRKTMATVKSRRRTSHSSLNITLAESQTLQSVSSTSDSSSESSKLVRAKKVILKSKNNKQIKKHITGDDDNSDSGTEPLEQVAKKVTSKSQRSKHITRKTKKHITSDISDSSPESLEQIRAKKVTSKSQNHNAKLKHITGDPSDSSDTDLLTVRKQILESQNLYDNNKSKTNAANDSDPPIIKSRKLYDPNMSIQMMDIDDEKERQEKRDQGKKRQLEQSGFVNPVATLFENLAKTATDNSESQDQESEASPPKQTKKTPAKKPVKTVSANNDEQAQLLDEVLNRQKKPQRIESRRRSMRILNTNKKATTSKIVPVTPSNRRSTMDFVTRTQTSSRKKIDTAKLPTIVCTRLHRVEVQDFTQIVKKLGRFIVEDEVSHRTTHLIAGEAKKTLNMLRAIARGCWVLKHEWIHCSLEAGKWLPEENYEIDNYSPAIRKCRLERQAFGTKYTMDVFESCPPVYVALGTTPRCSDLKDLICTCKGKIVSVPRMARIIVGQYVDDENVVCVNETWVLDCVHFYKKMDFEDYLIKSGNIRKSIAV